MKNTTLRLIQPNYNLKKIPVKHKKWHNSNIDMNDAIEILQSIHTIYNGKLNSTNTQIQLNCFVCNSKSNTLGIEFKDDHFQANCFKCAATTTVVIDILKNEGIIKSKSKLTKNELNDRKKENDIKIMQQKAKEIKDDADTQENIKNVLDNMTTIDNITNSIKIKEYFKNRNLTVDGTFLDSNTIIYPLTTHDNLNIKSIQIINVNNNFKKIVGKGHINNKFYNLTPNHTNNTVIIGEGIFTVQSVKEITKLQKNVTFVAMMTANNLINYKPTNNTKTIYILVDSDKSKFINGKQVGMTGQRCSTILANKMSKLGIKVKIVTPDDSCFTDTPNKLDFNDLNKKDIKIRLSKAKDYKITTTIEDDMAPIVNGKILDLNADDIELQIKAISNAERQRLLSLNAIDPNIVFNRDYIFTDCTKRRLDKLAKFFFNIDIDGKYLWCTHKNEQFAFFNYSSFTNKFKSEKATVITAKGKLKIIAITTLWCSWINENKKAYNGLVFDPSNTSDSSMYNTFNGLLEPVKGDCSLFLNHLKEIICDNDENAYNYILTWMSRIVKSNGAIKSKQVLAFKGVQGSGKSLVTEYFSKIFKTHYSIINNIDQLLGRFNFDLNNKILIGIEELSWFNKKRYANMFKDLITVGESNFEAKGIQKKMMKNYMNFIITSNEDWVVPATYTERRFSIFNINPKHACNKKYFDPLFAELNGSGPAALMRFLLDWDEHKEIDTAKPYENKALTEQREYTTSIYEQFMVNLLEREILLQTENGNTITTKCDHKNNDLNKVLTWPAAIFKDELYLEYKRFCDFSNYKYILTPRMFWSKMKVLFPDNNVNTAIYKTNNKTKRCFLLPSIEDLKIEYIKTHKGYIFK